MLASETLKQLSSFNEGILKTINLSSEVTLDRISFPIETPLMTLVGHGIQEPYAAPHVLTAVLEILQKQTKCVFSHSIRSSMAEI